MLLRHALRNAAVPIATIIGVGIAVLISGVVVTEFVFNLPVWDGWWWRPCSRAIIR